MYYLSLTSCYAGYTSKKQPCCAGQFDCLAKEIAVVVDTLFIKANSTRGQL